MKASVITLQSVYNYGTQLQAYATQQKLLEYFDDVEYVNYRRPDTFGSGLIKLYSNGNPVRFSLFLPTYFKWKKSFGRFQNKYLKIGSKEYVSDEDFEHFEDKYDVYFSGSDQVWNTGWNNGIIPYFYLSYAPDNKPKFAYSSSFGLSKLDKKDVPEIKRLLSRYNYMSVREQTGVNIIKNQLGLKNAIQLNDPTLAFDGDWWRKLKTKNKIKGKYILIYNLNNNPDFDKYAEEAANRTGLKLYRFCTRYDQIRKNGKSILVPEVQDFITLIDDAELVITDSFHATALSANLETNFISLLPSKYSSRITDFTKMVGLYNRVAKSYDDFSPLDSKADFGKTTAILAKTRAQYDAFLNKVMEDIKHA